jgi:protoheme IX farnesyltransferase
MPLSPSETLPPISPSIASPQASKVALESVAPNRMAVHSGVDSLTQSPSVARDFYELTKPRILMMILITAGVGLVATDARPSSVGVVILTMIGTAAFAASASVLNQWYEQEQDALMPRTQGRPLPAGRLTSLEAAAFGWFLLAVGISVLGLTVGTVPMLLGLATWFLYVWVYTPMKQMSWWNTAVGTIPGAMPVLMGWTAAGGSLFDWRAWALTMIVVLWQFPHFMAIAWLYREQYKQAGYQMLTSVEPTGRSAGLHAIGGAALLVPFGIAVMVPISIWSGVLALVVVALAIYQFKFAWKFYQDRTMATARSLLRCSLLYLPICMALVVVRAFL